MIEVIDFLTTDENRERKIFGTVAIILGKEGEIKVTAGDERFSAFIEDELRHGVKMMGKEGLLFPKDGENFIQAILLRFSGSYLWAERKPD